MGPLLGGIPWMANPSDEELSAHLIKYVVLGIPLKSGSKH
jgi:hypothetical protein